jgi:hypothetical protein
VFLDAGGQIAHVSSIGAAAAGSLGNSLTNRDAVATFSPALADAVGLRWVNEENGNNAEGVVSGEFKPRNMPNTRKEFWVLFFAWFAWFAVETNFTQRLQH